MFASLCARALAQATPVGGEFQVNTYTSRGQYATVVALDDDGDFVVTWQSYRQDGSSSGVFVRRFNAAGVGQGNEFQVNTYSTNTQRYPALAVEADGDFVVTWESEDQDGADYGIFARRFSATGVAQGIEFQVNTYTPGQQARPAVAVDGDGDFVITWQSFGQDDYFHAIFARRFNAAGAAQAVEFQVNTYTFNYQTRPAVAMSRGGDFVVTWQSNVQDGASYGIFARRFNAVGAPQAAELQVNTYTTNNQSVPDIAMGVAGDFVVAWNSYRDGSTYGIFARRFNAAGAPLATEFQVNTYTPGKQYQPAVAVDGDGDFVVAWGSLQDGYFYGVFARRFGAVGAPQAVEFQINTFTEYSQYQPSVGIAPGGDFVVAWASGRDGSVVGTFAQRFVVPKTFDIDANGAADALTDGLLFLRYAFGFRGATLIAGAVAGNCTRCAQGPVESYLDGIGSTQSDIDGNGAVGALTDGLLVLRYLFGFRGATLTTGAVDAGCTRCTSAAIESYIAAKV